MLRGFIFNADPNGHPNPLPGRSKQAGPPWATSTSIRQFDMQEPYTLELVDILLILRDCYGFMILKALIVHHSSTRQDGALEAVENDVELFNTVWR